MANTEYLVMKSFMLNFGVSFLKINKKNIKIDNKKINFGEKFTTSAAILVLNHLLKFLSNRLIKSEELFITLISLKIFKVSVNVLKTFISVVALKFFGY